MDQPRKPSAVETMVLRESLTKLKEADADLKTNEDRIVAEMETMRQTVAELERQGQELVPTSQGLAGDMSGLTQGTTVLQRQLNRRDAERTIAQKKAVDRAIMDLRLRAGEINDAVAQLEKALSQVRASRATLAVHMDKLKDLIGDERASSYTSL